VWAIFDWNLLGLVKFSNIWLIVWVLVPIESPPNVRFALVTEFPETPLRLLLMINTQLTSYLAPFLSNGWLLVTFSLATGECLTLAPSLWAISCECADELFLSRNYRLIVLRDIADVSSNSGCSSDRAVYSRIMAYIFIYLELLVYICKTTIRSSQKHRKHRLHVDSVKMQQDWIVHVSTW